MLISKEDEDKLEQTVEAIAIALGIYLVGRDIVGRPITRAMQQGTDLSATTLLEDAYMAGKAVQVLGEEQFKMMTVEETRAWAAQHTTLTPAEQANLDSIKESTELWLTSRMNAWKQEVKKVVTQANAVYTAVVATTVVAADAAEQAVKREAAKRELEEEIVKTRETIRQDMDKIVQTEMATFFQEGQTSQFEGGTEVYKKPRPDACEHCFRLHMWPDGSPKIYKLADVAGNTNDGQPAWAWVFVVGPVHPHCYCILHSVVSRNPGGPDPVQAQFRKQAMTPKTKS